MTTAPDKSLFDKTRDELAWLRFVIPRQFIQLASKHLPLSQLRDALPAPLVKQLRVGLYPARVERASAPSCERRNLQWGDPANLDPAHPIQFNGPPRASILLITYGNLALTRLCLASLQRAAIESTTPFEIIVVDNASPDDSAIHLGEVAASQLLPLRLIANRQNLGFAAANNQAAQLATSEFLVFLNNDTVVTQGWLDRLIDQLKANPEIGLLGPMTNSCGNPEVELPTSYSTLPAMAEFAAGLSENKQPEIRDVSMIPLFCAAMPKALYNAAGGLDAGYGLGMFEDDDLAQAVRARGKRVAVSTHTFVHHYGGAAFSRLPPIRYLRIFWENRRRFERKWQTRWQER